MEFTSTQICGSKKIFTLYCRAVRNAWSLFFSFFFKRQLARTTSHSRRMTVLKNKTTIIIIMLGIDSANVHSHKNVSKERWHEWASPRCKVTLIPPQRGSHCGIESMRNIFEQAAFNRRKWTSLDFRCAGSASRLQEYVRSRSNPCYENTRDSGVRDVSGN